MSDCIEHPGYIGKNGYGQKKYRGKIVAAHRLVYALANGLDVFLWAAVYCTRATTLYA